MADISEEIQAIRAAEKGKDVRGSIADALEAMNEQAAAAEEWATGSGSGGTPSATNNAKYYSEQAAIAAAETDRVLETYSVRSGKTTEPTDNLFDILSGRYYLIQSAGANYGKLTPASDNWIGCSEEIPCESGKNYYIKAFGYNRDHKAMYPNGYLLDGELYADSSLTPYPDSLIDNQIYYDTNSNKIYKYKSSTTSFTAVNAAIFYIWYDEDLNPIGTIASGGSMSANNANVRLLVTAPSTAKYLAFSVYCSGTTSADTDLLMVKGNWDPPYYVPPYSGVDIQARKSLDLTGVTENICASKTGRYSVYNTSGNENTGRIFEASDNYIGTCEPFACEPNTDYAVRFFDVFDEHAKVDKYGYLKDDVLYLDESCIFVVSVSDGDFCYVYNEKWIYKYTAEISEGEAHFNKIGVNMVVGFYKKSTANDKVPWETISIETASNVRGIMVVTTPETAQYMAVHVGVSKGISENAHICVNKGTFYPEEYNESVTGIDYVARKAAVQPTQLHIGTYNIGLFGYGIGGFAKLESDPESPFYDAPLWNKKFTAIKRFIGQQRFDILGLQEFAKYYAYNHTTATEGVNDLTKDSDEDFLRPIYPYFHRGYSSIILCSAYKLDSVYDGKFTAVYNNDAANTRYYTKAIMNPNGNRLAVVVSHLEPTRTNDVAGSEAIQNAQMQEIVDMLADEENALVFADWNRSAGDFQVMENAGFTMLNGAYFDREYSCRDSWKRPTVNHLSEMTDTTKRYTYGGHENGHEQDYGKRFEYRSGEWQPIAELDDAADFETADTSRQYVYVGVTSENFSSNGIYVYTDGSWRYDGSYNNLFLDNIAAKGNVIGEGNVVDILGESLSDHIPFVADVTIW